MFAGIREAPLSDELAADLQEILDEWSVASGLTATVITPDGTWSGAAGTAAGVRAMSPADQMAIGSVTKSLVAAQVMQLVEAGELSLDDPAAGRLPPGIDFDTNGATIGDLLAMRSGIPDYVDALWGSLYKDKLRAWTTDEVLALVGTGRTPANEEYAYSSTNYVLLGLIVEQVRGRPLVEVLRAGALSGAGYERLVYQPDERPTRPMAVPFGAPADTLEEGGGYLPSLAGATAAGAAGAMASDSATLARWWARFCAGEVVSESSLEAMTDFRDDYGLGLADLTEKFGSPAVGHGGAHVGFSAYAGCLPELGIVIAVLANGERPAYQYHEIPAALVLAASA